MHEEFILQTIKLKATFDDLIKELGVPHWQNELPPLNLDLVKQTYKVLVELIPIAFQLYTAYWSIYSVLGKSEDPARKFYNEYAGIYNSISASCNQLRINVYNIALHPKAQNGALLSMIAAEFISLFKYLNECRKYREFEEGLNASEH